MKLSTKSRYGLTAMVDIALNAVSENVTIKSISERQHISEGYLEQIFSLLRKAGLVKSIKGAQGGYLLGAPASDITVGSILNCIEGDISFNEKVDSDPVQDVIRDMVWTQLDDSIEKLLNSITLEKLVFEYRMREDSSKVMYYI